MFFMLLSAFYLFSDVALYFEITRDDYENLCSLPIEIKIRERLHGP